MPAPAFKTLRRFGRSNSGATAVEFAMVALPLIALILASLQTAIIFFFDEALQTATEQSARQLMTGSAQLSDTTQTQFANVVCANAPAPFQCSNIMVDVQSASSFSSINTSPLTLTYDVHGNVTNTWSYSPGNPGDIVIVRVMYNWPVFGGPLAFGLANQPNGNHLLVATAVFKNEPYQ
ncbi:MAG: TadE/TadG family type IV pilus assembly protein [Caulobacterales bacterium]